MPIRKEIYMNPSLHPYQQQVKDFILTRPHCGIFLQMGLGKTLISLSALNDLYATNQITGHTLVIAPKNIARSTWIDEIEKWNFKFPYKSLIVNENGKPLSKKKREELYLEALTAPPTVYFINRELIVNLIDFYIDRKVKPNGRYNFQQGWIFENIIIDEFQSFKSYNSERFKALKFANERGLIRRLIGLTGTPTPNGLEDLWAEMFLIDNGARLEKNITKYRRRFFNEGRYVNGYPIEYIPKPGAEEVIYGLIKDVTISLKNTMLQLPPLTYNDVYVHMTDSERKLYKSMARTNVLDIDEFTTITAANSAVLSAKLSQMASGAIYLPTDDTNPLKIKHSVPEYAIIHKQKLEQLEYLINNTDSPVLVAYHFQSDYDMILNYFAGIKDAKPVTLFDGSPEMIHAWNNKQIPVMLIQPASAGFGLNFQEGGHTLVWYTIPWSLEEYLQTNARIYRQGQTQPVVIHRLLTENTIDKRILDCILQKDANEENLLNAVELAIADIDT